MQLLVCMIHQCLHRDETHSGKQRVETVDLLSFCHICIILSDAFQRQFLHQVNFIRFLQMIVLDQKIITSQNAKDFFTFMNDEINL